MPLKNYDAIQLKPEFEGTLGNHDAIQSHPKRTVGLDEVAEYIQTEVVEKGRWPMDMTDIADEVDYSRQHVSNCITEYFVPADSENMGQGGSGSASTSTSSTTGSTTRDSPMSATPDQQPAGGTPSTGGENGTKSVFVEIDGHMQEIVIDIPDGVDRASYVKGYLDRINEE